jgi:3-oxoacyl-[acyl-carrier protein] reductase
MISLLGKTALVTGASRGIGRATALLLARAGADVALTCHSRRSDADLVAQEIRHGGRKAYVGAGPGQEQRRGPSDTA